MYLYKCQYCPKRFSTKRAVAIHQSFYRGRCVDHVGAVEPEAETDVAPAPPPDTPIDTSSPPLDQYPEDQQQDTDTGTGTDTTPIDPALLQQYYNSFIQDSQEDPASAAVFDSTFEVFNLLSSWGLSAQRQQQLLDLLHNPKFRADQVRYTSVG